jgi:hypothetical protein
MSAPDVDVDLLSAELYGDVASAAYASIRLAGHGALLSIRTDAARGGHAKSADAGVGRLGRVVYASFCALPPEASWVRLI